MMPYTPNTADPHDLGKVYKTIWISAAASVPTFINTFLGWDNIWMALLMGCTAGGLIVASFANQTDEYFRAMIDTGKRWALLSLAIYLFALFMFNNFDIAHSIGFALAADETQTQPSTALRFALDANVLGTGLAVIFYAGYAFAWSKDRWGG